MTWQLLSGYLDMDYRIFFEYVDAEPSQITRQSSNKLNLKIKPFRTELRRHTFSQRAALQWNTLPNFVRESRELNEFKNRYDNLMEEIRSQQRENPNPYL